MASLPPHDESLLMFLQGKGEIHRKQESHLDAAVLLPLSQAGYKAPFSPFFPWKRHTALQVQEAGKETQSS